MPTQYSTGTVVPFLFPAPEVLGAFKGLSMDPRDDFPDGVRDVLPEGWWEEEDGETYLTEELQEAFRCLDWEDAEGDSAKGLYLFAEEGAPDEIVEVIQWLLEHDTKGTPWATFEGAFTCSKTAPGQFGGFAWFITKDSAECVGTGTWLRKKAEEWKKAQEAKKPAS